MKARGRVAGFGPLAGIGTMSLLLTALGGPALRMVGDNGFIALALASGLLTLLAAHHVGRVPDGRAALALILGFALALRLVALAEPPLLSDDIYRYVWDGRVLAAGINPYRYVPADPALAPLQDSAVFPLINRADYAVTIYPPVAQAFFFLVTRVSESITAMRAALVLCEGVIVAATIALLNRIGSSPARVVAYAWHPLPVWEVANNGHVDALMAAFLMAGLWLAIAGRRPLAGAALVTLGALAKPFALLALPAVWRPWNIRMVLIVAAVIAAAYLPFLSVGRGVLGFLASGYVGEQRLDTGAGFWALRMWRSVAGEIPGDTMAYLLLAGTLVCALALKAGFQRDESPEVVLGNICRLLIVVLVLLSPDYPWYFLPVVAFLALIGSPTGWALTIGGFMLYDVVANDPQVPFDLRAGLFNGVVLASALAGWRVRRAEAG